MPNQGNDQQTVTAFTDSANVIGRLASDEKAFRAAYNAFRAGDAKKFHAVLEQEELIGRCDIVCEWIRIKECVFLCLELCGPPRRSTDVPNQRALADAIVRITSDEKRLRELVAILDKRDHTAFRRICEEYELGELCHFFCHWLCVVRYRLMCRYVCSIEKIERPDLAAELKSAGAALRGLLQHKEAFDHAVTASNAGNAAALNSAIKLAGLIGPCSFVCEWFCSWRCAYVCWTFCRDVEFERTKDEIGEALAFARVASQLAQKPEIVERLIAALSTGNAKTWVEIVRELGWYRYCIQLCQWLCTLRCRAFCILLCPPPYSHPWFTHVGDFGIDADISPTTGLTNTAQNGHGGPGYGFFGSLTLRGFCPKTDPANPGASMAYRFLYAPAGGGAPVPITGDGLVYQILVGTRLTLWQGNPNALQSVRIRGSGPTPTPPVGPPSASPPDHFIVPDANGWVIVDPASLDDGFYGPLMGFATGGAFPGGSPAPGVTAGNAVPVANRKNGDDSAIVFQATRVTTIAAVNGGAPPDYTNQLPKIHINNWSSVALIDLAEFAGGMACAPVTNMLDILYTTDHELMLSWYIDVTTAAVFATPPTFPSGTGPRGSQGTDSHDTTAWPACSYLLKLHTVRSLTDGLNDDSDDWTSHFLTFCIEH